MGMRNYYFLIAGLPDLAIEQGKLQFGSDEFRIYLQEQLHPKDYELIEWLFLPRDNRNLIRLIEKATSSWDNTALYSLENLQLAIAEVVSPEKLILNEKSKVKPYIKNFLNCYFRDSRRYPQMTPENELSAFFFFDLLKIKNSFVNQWFAFELNLKNVLAYSAAQKYGMPYENQLIGDTALARALQKKVGRDLSEAGEWPWFERVMHFNDNADISQREKAIDQLRWSVLDEMNTFNYFSIEIIFSYMIKIIMIERWLQLDPKTGDELFRRLLGDLQSGYEFPNEFSI